jgi:hypothetical protein
MAYDAARIPGRDHAVWKISGDNTAGTDDEPEPTVTPWQITAFPPTHTSLPMVTGAPNSSPKRLSAAVIGWHAV